MFAVECNGCTVCRCSGGRFRGRRWLSAFLLQVRHQGEELRGSVGRTATTVQCAAGNAAQIEGEESEEGEKGER